MQIAGDHEELGWVRAKFSPVAQALGRLAMDIERIHGRSVVLEQRSPMQQTAQNTYAVGYSLRQPNEAGFTLTFIVTGEDADLLLLQAQEQSGFQDNRANPPLVDQRVYRLEKVEEIRKAVWEKIARHLASRKDPP